MNFAIRSETGRHKIKAIMIMGRKGNSMGKKKVSSMHFFYFWHFVHWFNYLELDVLFILVAIYNWGYLILINT